MRESHMYRGTIKYQTSFNPQRITGVVILYTHGSMNISSGVFSLLNTSLNYLCCIYSIKKER